MAWGSSPTGGYSSCEERESKIICKADFMNLLTIDGLTPLCQEKGGCGKCKVEDWDLHVDIICEIAAQNNTSARPQETPKPQETNPQFPPQRDDVNGVDTGPVSPQQMEKLICNQFKDPKANCENALRQCVFEQKDNLRNFNSPKDFWQAVGECASKVLTLKEH
ncbi:hypothetical protein MHUMG1_10623 [Metarhizium humberi]|uniref:Uncharacterized protein n=1 Tax=Metarhizium humberi TaxID=2596975 RepID=A0A9P8M0R4_9HYPO|nr:hypothetical protein MHUMG1_10623 [Metarhizium humberi]